MDTCKMSRKLYKIGWGGGGGGGEGGNLPFRVSSSTLSHFMPSNPGLGTARQDHIKTITYSAVA